MSRSRTFPRRAGGGAVLRVLLVLVLLGVVGLGIAVWRDYRRFTDSPLPGARADATIDIARGASYRDIVRQLRRERVSRAAPRVAKALRLLFIAPMIVPLMVIGVGFYVLYARLRLLGGFVPLGAAHAVLVHLR